MGAVNQEEIHNILVALLSGDEKEIYKALNKKKEIDDKSPNLRTVEEKNILKSLRNKMRYFPKNLMDGIKKKFPDLQRTHKTAEQRKEQVKESNRQKRAAESETDKEMRKEQDKECKRQKRAAESEKDKEMRLKKQKKYDEKRIADSQIVCDICNSSNHLCRKCKNTVCNFCGERDPSSENEMHIMHKENDTRCTVGESEIERQRRLNNQKEYEHNRNTKAREIRAKKVQEVREKRLAESEKEKERRLNKQRV